MTTKLLSLNWQFDHVGIAVWDITTARQLYCRLGFACSEILHNPALNVNVVFCHGAGTVIELVAPLNEKSPCIFYLNRLGPGTYHVCYRCDDLEEALRQLKKLKIKYKVVARPVPRAQSPLLFLLIPTCGLIELVVCQA